jgi:hypothetical protein
VEVQLIAELVLDGEGQLDNRIDENTTVDRCHDRHNSNFTACEALVEKLVNSRTSKSVGWVVPK